jgi:tetratricopeptide (TPR) repeat protein
MLDRASCHGLLMRLMRGFIAALIAGSMAGQAGGATGESASPHDHALGVVDFPVSCHAAARAEFDHAVALLHHMTYPQAREGFRRVAELEPRCAMAYWGIAMTLFQPLWPTRPDAAALHEGWEAVTKARSLAPPTERERMFVAAAEAFFREPASPDYWLRIRRWAEAQEQVRAAFPEDDEGAVFAALGILATAPSDRIERDHADRAAAILLEVYERNPDHPGAMHYLVHANDVPGRERELLDITRRYESLAPDNPHALHMPTHIYTRLGAWDAVVSGNLRAGDAALRFPAGDAGQYVWDEFPHAIEYLIYAYLQQGNDDAAAAQLRRLQETANLEPTFKTAFHLASTQARFALERGAWSEAAAIVPREPATLDWDRYAWPEAIAWFARGFGAVRLGQVEAAQAAAIRIATLEATARTGGEALFARHIGVLRLELDAWLAHARNDREQSFLRMRAALDLEAATPKHPVTPAPVLPAGEQLGELYMAIGQPADALASYERELARYPRRLNGLLGAARAAAASGAPAGARNHYAQVLEVAAASTRPGVLDEARSGVAGNVH